MNQILFHPPPGSGPGSDSGDRGPDPLGADGHRQRHGGPAVPRVHRRHGSEPGQGQTQEVSHRCGLARWVSHIVWS